MAATSIMANRRQRQLLHYRSSSFILFWTASASTIELSAVIAATMA